MATATPPEAAVPVAGTGAAAHAVGADELRLRRQFLSDLTCLDLLARATAKVERVPPDLGGGEFVPSKVARGEIAF
ncbi:hypothetical protein [Streptomyces sp. NPDC056105]|uniref:hypothetical protein n=1 Tax=Streptomyces sp. NPDC056105 TaxID=3345714 RepID=UPI0035E0FC88